MSLLTPAVLWAIFGFLLLIVELLTMGFVLVFFGVAALLVALLKGVFGLDHLVVELLLFAAFGAVGLALLRQKLMSVMKRGSGAPSLDRKQVIKLTADVAAGGTAKVEYQGTPWDALNESAVDLRAGDKAVIVATKGIQLILRPES